MAITERQKELDLVKWEKSQLLGLDACGTFDYCKHCDKAMENPCDNAYTKLSTPVVEEVEPKKPATKKATAKKTTTKKTTAKKETAKKTTKKTATKKTK